MCNPRRVQVTLSQDLALAWEREISRSVALSAKVTGEARLMQSLTDSIGLPVQRALEILLAQGCEGWEELEQGYRYLVDGGYVIYDSDNCTLEIVATLGGQVETEATATRVVDGEIQEILTTTQEGRYYDDGYGGRTEDTARNEAQLAAETKQKQAIQARLAAVQERAEHEYATSVSEQATAAAKLKLGLLEQEEQNNLSLQARENLGVVGVRCRQVFNNVLGQAYRDAILAYARSNGADSITCEDDGDAVEIEFFMER